MDLFLQQLANGLVIGSTYAVVAIGFALAFTVLRVINFAHPDIFMVGMFAGLVAAFEWPTLGFLVVLVAGALGAGLVGFALERTVIAPSASHSWLSSASMCDGRRGAVPRAPSPNVPTWRQRSASTSPASASAPSCSPR